MQRKINVVNIFQVCYTVMKKFLKSYLTFKEYIAEICASLPTEVTGDISREEIICAES